MEQLLKEKKELEQKILSMQRRCEEIDREYSKLAKDKAKDETRCQSSAHRTNNPKNEFKNVVVKHNDDGKERCIPCHNVVITASKRKDILVTCPAMLFCSHEECAYAAVAPEHVCVITDAKPCATIKWLCRRHFTGFR